MDVLKKVPVREQDPKVRATNFEEVCLGYNEQEAMEEASRCINCKNAQCMKGCPVSINIPAFIEQVKLGNFEAAYHIINHRLLHIRMMIKHYQNKILINSICNYPGNIMIITRIKKMYSVNSIRLDPCPDFICGTSGTI